MIITAKIAPMITKEALVLSISFIFTTPVP
jgi:hypothetical protein